MNILERVALLMVKPITCKDGRVIFDRKELLHVSWNGYDELTEAAERFCLGHCNNDRCWADQLHTKLEPLRKKKII